MRTRETVSLNTRCEFLTMEDREPSTFRPLHNLYSALLNRCLMDVGINIENMGEPCGRVSPAHRRSARLWLRSQDDRFLGFRSVCSILELDPDVIGDWIKDRLRVDANNKLEST